jgi:hypothetical protein
MLTDIIKLKVPHVNSQNSFNILLHVTILFLILSLFFRFYICGITTNMINKEIDHIISDSIKSSSSNIDQIKSKINSYKQVKNNLLAMHKTTNNKQQKKEISNKISDVKNIMNNLKILVPEFTEISNKNNMINEDIINNITNKINNNFSYDYYVNLFSKEDTSRKQLNDYVFFYTNIINSVLILTIILFGFYLRKTNSMGMNEMKLIFFENILTFACVGVVEYLFFTKVALKFIPAPPSTMYTSFVNSLKKHSIV